MGGHWGRQYAGRVKRAQGSPSGFPGRPTPGRQDLTRNARLMIGEYPEIRRSRLSV